MNIKFSINSKFNRTLANILSILVILAMAFPVTGSVSAQDADPPPPSPWRDDFNGTLDEGWYWLNENPDKWNLTDNPGFLRIYASPYATGGESLLLRPVAPGDFMIKTRVLFEPDTNFQIAGLVIWQDEQNFLQLGRAFCDVESACVGNGIYFDKVLSGNSTDGNFATSIDNPSDVFLRLERRSDMVRAFYSMDEGTSWYEIGIHWIPSGFQVNAIGLTASQDINTPDWDLPADFDFFELTEGWGFLPDGFHDYDQGDVPPWACNAGGWAADPDDRAADVNVEIVVDHQTVTTLPAGEFRQDLLDAGVCEDGNCSFSTSLWDLISSYEPHRVDVWAQDDTGEWVLLSNSAKTLTCRTYDIYTFDPTTGTTQQITNLPDTHEYNPRWSPDGKKIVHDTWNTDWSSHGVYITNVQTGVSSPLAGAEGGSYPTWSPSGKWIAFDRGADNDYRVFIVPPTGGTPKLVVEDAFMATWSPNSKRLAFHRPDDGGIWTADLDGVNQTKVAERGNGPAWSPDGEWIAFEVDGNVWKVRVNNNGNPLGDPIQLTSSPAWEGRPTWSNNSKTIAFHAGMGEDTDIWTIPASGGTATWLTGAPAFGDYDPNYSFNGLYVAYSSFSLDGQAARQWVAAYTYDPPVGTFDAGVHPYHFDFAWSMPEPGAWSGQGGEFNISSEADLYGGYVLLRGPMELRGVDPVEGLVCEEVGEINTNQPTRFLIGWLAENGETTYPEARAHFDSTTATAVWDDGSASLARHEIIPFNEGDWFNYVCAFTEAPPRMDLRVNYGHDWVESFYEAGHAVSLRVTDSEGNVKATAEVVTEPKDYWGGGTGFQSADSAWFDADANQLNYPPDIQPYDWVYAQVDNGATAKVQIGDISGMIDLDADSTGGTINAPWFSDPVQVECLDWGSGQDPPFDNKDGGFVLTNGEDPYSCSWVEEWNIQPGQAVGVGYLGPDSHWVANAFTTPNTRFTVWPEWNYLEGYEWPDGALVSISVDGKEVCSTEAVSGFPEWDPSNTFFSLNFPEGCAIGAEDLITLSFESLSLTHQVPELAITDVDLDFDTVTGTAVFDPEQYILHTWIHGVDGSYMQLSAAEGAWLADFSLLGLDLQAGMGGRVELVDQASNATAVEWYASNPRIVASITEDWFYLVEFAPETTINYSVYESEGGTEVSQGTATTDGSGSVWVDADGRWNLEPGTYLVVSDGISPKDLVIEGFTFDTFDTSRGTLQGTVPGQEGRLIWVGIGLEGDGLSMEVLTDAEGNWVADFSAPVPTDYQWVAAQIFDDDGDASELRPASQIIFLRPLCGTTYTAQANIPLEIRYGSWVAIGEGLANQNAEHLTVELVLNGEMVTGVQQPVVPGSEIPCGAPPEDAYGVFYVTQVASISPGTYVAEVTWILDEAVTDGYDADGDGEPNWYGPGEVFTHEFTIIAQ